MAVRDSRQEPSGAVWGRVNERSESPENPFITRLSNPVCSSPRQAHMTQATEFFITHVLEPPQEYTDAEETGEIDRKSTRLNSSHIQKSRMPSSA